MNRSITPVNLPTAMLMFALLLAGCDQIQRISSGGGDEKDSSASKKLAETESGGEPEKSEPEEPVSKAPNTVVRLDAFTDFDCTANWTNRDGGLGLTVGSGRGTCQTTFTGGSGRYQIELLAQTEREGQSPYRISINGNTVGSGKFPFSQGQVICECYKQPWWEYCPDVVMNLDAGVHQINTGDVVEYYGEEEYLCGKHGAYSKWRGMVFTPVD